jgi:hypothetical protein
MATMPVNLASRNFFFTETTPVDTRCTFAAVPFTVTEIVCVSNIISFINKMFKDYAFPEVPLTLQ